MSRPGSTCPAQLLDDEGVTGLIQTVLMKTGVSAGPTAPSGPHHRPGFRTTVRTVDRRESELHGAKSRQ
jgi:hypothetical protein